MYDTGEVQGSRERGATSLKKARSMLFAVPTHMPPRPPLRLCDLRSSQEKASPRASSGRRGCVFVISHGPGSGKLHKIAYIGPELIVLHKSSTKVKSPRPPSRAPRRRGTEPRAPESAVARPRRPRAARTGGDRMRLAGSDRGDIHLVTAGNINEMDK